MEEKYIMALDAGTSSNRCIIFDKNAQICSVAQKSFQQIFPKAGWVEHDAMEIWDTQLEVMKKAIKKLRISPKNIEAIGITNQRETTVVWNKTTGEPIHNAIVWQCKRTSQFCEQLKTQGYAEMIREKTGLVIDSYFSASKIKWLLDNVEGARKKAEAGELLFGTIDCWLLWKLTGGQIHSTDYSNASRTMLFNIHTLEWDKDLLTLFNIPESMLPSVKPSSFIYGETANEIFGTKIKIAGLIGDQQGALFGQMCFEKGNAKNTYGTGCFLLMNTGEKAVKSENGLITTIAWGEGKKINYALEGSVFIAGAGIQWLRDELKFFKYSPQSEELALEVADTNGCYVVPAFVGLGAPYWNQNARGIITGITRGVNKNHITRAMLESLAYQTYDVLKAMEIDSKTRLTLLKVDGGASNNNFLMQFQSDILNVEVARPQWVETTAMGASFLAGLATGYWKSKQEIKSLQKNLTTFSNQITPTTRTNLLKGWHEAVNLINKI